MRILVVEDEKRIADFLGRGLQGAGYAIDVALDGATALQFTHDTDYDLVILDLMLPDYGRSQGPRADPRAPYRAAGAHSQRARSVGRPGQRPRNRRGRLPHQAVCFRGIAGARQSAAPPRPAPAPEKRLQVADLALDCARRRKVIRGNENIELAPKEFGILEYMMRNKGRPLSRTMIVEHVWDMDYDGLTNIVDVYIRHLRSKIDDRFSAEKLIHTVRGIGYMIEAPEKNAQSPRTGLETAVRSRKSNTAMADREAHYPRAALYTGYGRLHGSLHPAARGRQRCSSARPSPAI